MITVTVNKVKLFGSVNFNGSDPGAPVITANKFRINAVSAGSEVVVTIAGGTITTDVP